MAWLLGRLCVPPRGRVALGAASRASYVRVRLTPLYRTADTLEGLSAEHWASAVQEATRLPPFRDGAHAAGVAASRWFKNDEVYDLLVNGLTNHGFQLQTSLASKPASGSLRCTLGPRKVR